MVRASAGLREAAARLAARPKALVRRRTGLNQEDALFHVAPPRARFAAPVRGDDAARHDFAPPRCAAETPRRGNRLAHVSWVTRVCITHLRGEDALYLQGDTAAKRFCWKCHRLHPVTAFEVRV